MYHSLWNITNQFGGDTIEPILELAAAKVVFYEISIAGVARLLDLERFMSAISTGVDAGGVCFHGRSFYKPPTYRATARLDECHTPPIFTASRAPCLARKLKYS